jgi:colicin import membrane protein
MDGNSLIPVESVNGLELFTGTGKLDDLLARIRQETITIVPDVSTASGRKEIASLAYKVARSKTVIDDAGKELVADWKSKSSKVDAERKKARDFLDSLKDEVRRPLDEYEAEQERLKQAEAERIEADKRAAEDARQVEIARREAELAAREAEIAAREKAEVDRIAAEKAERDRQEREEHIRKEAAAKAERDAREAIERAAREAGQAKESARLAAEKAERDAAEASARAEREKSEAVRQAEERARRDAEQRDRDRLAEEARVRAEEERKAANRAHRAKINNAAVASLVEGNFDIETAKAIVTLIASGKVAHITVNY